MRLYSSELLHIQLDLFEEELEGDYEEMLSKFEKKKVLQRMESQQASVTEGDYLRVLLGHTGHQLIVPFESTTTGKLACIAFSISASSTIPTVTTAVDIILQKQPLNHPQDFGHYGIFNSTAGSWMDDATALLSSLGSGEIVCEFKMRPLYGVGVEFIIQPSHCFLIYRKLKVTKSKTSTTDEQQKEVTVDPNATVSSALSVVIQQFGLKQESDTEGEDYGFTMPDGDEAWLDDLKKLGEYRTLFTSPRIVLRRKPWVLKVFHLCVAYMRLTSLNRWDARFHCLDTA